MAQFNSTRYTLSGPAGAEQRIHDDQGKITRALFDAISPAMIESLILAGGYGRGEGGYRNRDGLFTPYNDYDYFVVSDVSRRGCKDLQKQLSKLGHALDAEIGVEVDFAILRKGKLSGLEFSLMNAELLSGHRVLAGDPEILAAMPKMPLHKIALAEFTRLMLNRGSLLLMNRRALKLGSISSDSDREQFSRYLDKAVLACGDARLAAAGRYDISYPVKLERLRTLNWPGGAGFLRDYGRALDSRFGPEPLLIPAGEEARAQSRVVGHWLEALAELETVRLGRLPDWTDYATSRIRKGQSRSSVRGLLRNIFVTLRDFGPAEFLRNPAWALRYPRERLISVLPGLLEPSIGVPVTQLAQTLSEPAATDRDSLAKVFLEYWPRYA